MKPGEKNLIIIKKIMSELNIPEKKNITTKEDGIFCCLEIETNQLGLISQSNLKMIPKNIRDEVFDKILSLHPTMDDIKIPSKFTESLRYDLVIYKVSNHKVCFLKTFEIQGDGHYEPIFGINEFIKTILSDAIKEKNGTIMIPFYKGIQKEKSLKEIIKKVCA